MLNDNPKKPKKRVDYFHPTRGQLFWRTQRECWRRMVTPFLMYLFMSLLLLSAQVIPYAWLSVPLGVVCILGGAAYNAHLCYQYGKLHFGELVAGENARRREAEGIDVGIDHRVEREYSAWKGFYIGFLIGVPVILFGCLAGAFFDMLNASGGENVWGLGQLFGAYSALALVMFTTWAIMPVLWLRNYVPAMAGLSLYWSLVMIVLPIVVSGVFYIVGAYSERRARNAEADRERRLEEARERAKNEVRVQTEEQRKKTLQSKKKK